MTIRKSITKEEEAKKLVEEVVRFILKSKKSQFQRKDFKRADALIELGIAKCINEEQELFEFETNSPLLTAVFYEIDRKSTRLNSSH